MKILIVGGVAGGASAAARARRLSEDAEIILFERGEYISFANCGMPYHISGAISDRQRLLVQTPQSMAKRFNIDVRVKTEVLKIARESKSVLVKNLATGAETKESYDALILSPGAEPIKPPLPGINSNKIFSLRNLSDMDAIIQKLNQAPLGRLKNAVVIGGGYIGLEMTEALRDKKIAVTLVELRDQVMEPVDKEMAALLHQELTLNGVALRLGTGVEGFNEEAGNLKVQLSSGKSVECDFAILSIGVKPEVKLAKEAGLAIGQRGGIQVDDNMRTSDPNIFAVGDAVETKDFVTGAKTLIPLAGPANREGRIAADTIFGKREEYKKTQGTAICKVFNLSVGMTGLNEKQLKKNSIPYEKVHIHPADHASYYPGASPISMKMLFDPSTGKILGAQAVGNKGVDKRIDIIAVAMRGNLTVRDLKDLELCYAPPYGSAKDPVNYLGFVASNILDGTVNVCHVEDIVHLKKDQAILDVRTDDEAALGKIPQTLHIPLDDLRGRLSELPQDKELLVYCRVGLRGYLACRILNQKGFKCRNLSGGFLTYEALMGKNENTPTLKEMKDDTGEHSETISTKKESVMKRIDACGLQCPGPIMQIKNALNQIAVGDIIEVAANDPAFPSDVKAWCQSTGNELLGLKAENGATVARIEKKEKENKTTAPNGTKSKTIVVFSNDLDKALAAFVIANGATAMGSKVTMFFTFWGINILRKSQTVSVKKNFIEHMFGWMMPRGANKLSLSKMHMGGAGTLLMKKIMKHKNVSSLPEFVEMAVKGGVKLVACSMSMDLMGIKKEELIDGVELGGVAMYLENAEQGNVNLFI